MPPSLRCREWCAFAVLAAWLVAALPERLAADQGEPLLPGQSREGSIAAGEKRGFLIQAPGSPVLITVEQRGIDLVVEAGGPAETPVAADAPNHAWGPEVLLLTGPGPFRLEIRPGQTFATPGRFLLRVEALPEGSPRIAALEAMSRGGRLAGDDEARRLSLFSYREALASWRSLGERRQEAEALQAIAELEEQEDDLPAAAEHFLAALALWRELAEPHREAVTLGRLGVTRQRAGDIEAAYQAQEGALALWKSLGERVEEAGARSELCLLEQMRGALSAALACHAAALEIFRQVGKKDQEAQILHNLGGVRDSLGEPDAALEHYGQALALRRELGDRTGEARTLNNIALIHRVLGEWQEALRVYGQVRDLLGPGDRAQEATRLNNVGALYNHLGEPERALTFFQEALKLRREVGDRRGELITLNNLGLAWRQLGDPDRALEHHRQALAAATGLNDSWQQAVTRMRLAEVALERGDPSGALSEIAPALGYLKSAGLRREEARALQLQGRASILAGRPREALPILQEALAARRAVRDRVGEAETLHALATAERALGLPREARAHVEEAIARVEELRTGFVSPELRAAFLATQRRAYALHIDLLMDRHAADPKGGDDRAALGVSEQARARSLLDVLDAGRSSAASTVPAALLQRRLSLRRLLSAKADRQVKQSHRKDAAADALGGEIEMLLADLDGVEAEIARQDPQAAALRQPKPAGVEEIAASLDPGTLFLEYALGEERSFLWVVGAGPLRSFVLPSRREIESLARRVYEETSTVEAGGAPSGKAAEDLGRILLAPFWSETAGLRRLVVVPDAVLHYLPFAALPVPAPGLGWETPRVPLLEHLEVVYLPSATTLALQRQTLGRRSPAPKRAAVLADPVFSADDPRLSSLKVPLGRGGAAGDLLPPFERLPSSRHEAEAIAALAPAGQVGTFLDLAASRETALSGELRSYRVLHFATHGIADDRTPELSGLVLSLVDAAGRPREGFLGLSDIYDLDLQADLVVLSGCRTALGKEVGGEGLLGITRAFLHAGAPRVVAGLWRVQDRATAELMTRFYRALWQDGLSPAAALREAQRSLRRDPRYRHPYFWSGFVLQGDWR